MEGGSGHTGGSHSLKEAQSGSGVSDWEMWELPEQSQVGYALSQRTLKTFLSLIFSVVLSKHTKAMPIYFLSALEWMETVVLLAVDKFLFPLESWLAVKQAFFNHVNSGYSFSCPNVPISWCFVNILNKPNSWVWFFSFFSEKRINPI